MESMCFVSKIFSVSTLLVFIIGIVPLSATAQETNIFLDFNQRRPGDKTVTSQQFNNNLLRGGTEQHSSPLGVVQRRGESTLNPDVKRFRFLSPPDASKPLSGSIQSFNPLVAPTPSKPLSGVVQLSNPSLQLESLSPIQSSISHPELRTSLQDNSPLYPSLTGVVQKNSLTPTSIPPLNISANTPKLPVHSSQLTGLVRTEAPINTTGLIPLINQADNLHAQQQSKLLTDAPIIKDKLNIQPLQHLSRLSSTPSDQNALNGTPLSGQLHSETTQVQLVMRRSPELPSLSTNAKVLTYTNLSGSLISWDQWYDTLQSLSEPALLQFLSKHGNPAGANTLSITISRNHEVIVNIVQPAHTDFDLSTIEAYRSLSGNTALKFPQGSCRKKVTLLIDHNHPLDGEVSAINSKTCMGDTENRLGTN